MKYRKINRKIHASNLVNGKVAEVKLFHEGCKKRLHDTLEKALGGTVTVDTCRLYFHPAAIIKRPETIEEYLEFIGAKSRNMIRKSEKKGFYTKVFEWNAFLRDIYEINTSAKFRQGKRMAKSYQEFPKEVTNKETEGFESICIGLFFDQKLIAYAELYIYGNFMMTNRILGHADYLKYGIMNHLIKAVVAFMIDNGIEYLNYLGLVNRKKNSLSAFKYRVGFREYSLAAVS